MLDWFLVGWLGTLTFSVVVFSCYFVGVQNDLKNDLDELQKHASTYSIFEPSDII